MIVHAHPSLPCPTTDWQSEFLRLLPRIKRYAQFALRCLQGEAHEEALSEVIAQCLCAYRRLFERNQRERAYASVLVRYAVAMYYRGRRVGTADCSHDLYATQARQAAGFELRSLGTPLEQRRAWMECLTDNRRTPVPDQVHFRIEFPRWLRMQTPRNRQIAERLAMGHSTAAVARRYKVSAGRISQIRRELHESWQAFTAERQPAAV